MLWKHDERLDQAFFLWAFEPPSVSGSRFGQETSRSKETQRKNRITGTCQQSGSPEIAVVFGADAISAEKWSSGKSKNFSGEDMAEGLLCSRARQSVCTVNILAHNDDDLPGVRE